MAPRLGILALACVFALAGAGAWARPLAPKKADDSWAEPCRIRSFNGAVDYVGRCSVKAPLDQLILMPAQRQALPLWGSGRRVWRPLAGDLIMAVGTQASEFEYPERQDIAGSARLSDGALIARARANAAPWVAGAKIAPDASDARAGHVLKVTSDDINPAALTLTSAFWARPEFKSFKGAPIILFSDEDSEVWIADAGDPAAQEELADLRRGNCQASQSVFVQSCSLAGQLFTPGPNGALAVWRAPTPSPSPPLASAASIGVSDEALAPMRGPLDWLAVCRGVTDWSDHGPVSVPDDRCIGRAPANQLFLIPMSQAAAARWPSGSGPGSRVVAPLAGDMVLVLSTEVLPAPPRRHFAGGDNLDDAALIARARLHLDDWAADAELHPYGGYWTVTSHDLPAAALALSPAFWRLQAFASFSGPPVIAFMTPDTLYVADGGDPRSLDGLAHVGGCRGSDSAYCSASELLFTPDGQGGLRVWGRFVADERTGARRVVALTAGALKALHTVHPAR